MVRMRQLHSYHTIIHHHRFCSTLPTTHYSSANKRKQHMRELVKEGMKKRDLKDLDRETMQEEHG